MTVYVTTKPRYSFKLIGSNTFNEGWLANLLGVPRALVAEDDAIPEEERAAWIDGWEMGQETGPRLMMAALLPAIVAGNVDLVVEEIPQ